MIKYRWATLGCGVIANQLAQALQAQGSNLYSVANRTHDKAVAFAEKYGIEKVYEDIDEVFTDDNVDIIYISTPHNTHIKYLRKALAAGKHVLCEKSITLNSQELDEAIKLAEDNHVILAEAMTIYHMPIYKKLNEIIASLVNLVDDTNMIYSFKTERVKFTAKQEIPWTLDGEYGGNHVEVEIENLKQAVDIQVRKERKI